MIRRKSQRHLRQAGLSVTELTVVVAIALIAAGITLPNAIQTWYDVELRANASEVAGIMQQARILAAKNNRYYPVRFQNTTGIQQVYVDLNLDNTLDAGDPVIDLPKAIQAASGAPSGNGQPAPYTLSGDTTSGTPFDNTNTLAFSPRGLPCNLTGTNPIACTTPAPSYFVYYFQDGRPNGWSAVLVTKAGKTKTLTWNGSTWH